MGKKYFINDSSNLIRKKLTEEILLLNESFFNFLEHDNWIKYEKLMKKFVEFLIKRHECLLNKTNGDNQRLFNRFV